MKRILLFIFTVFVCVFAACKKNTSSSGVQMSAVINNRPWASSSSNVSIDKSSGLHITITADSANTHMKLDIGNYAGAGTYLISDSGNTAVYTSYTNGVGSAAHKATSGNITVTAATSNGVNQNGIKGTFEFLADSVFVTTGNFDVKMNLN